MRAQSLLLTKYLSFIFIGLVLFSSCKKKDDDDISLVSNTTVNEWVTENMRIYYYWNRTIPSDRNLDFQLDPVPFFETVANRPTDRFSWISKADELEDVLSGISTSTGIDFILFPDGPQNVFGSVRYVIPGSPAELAGVKRGMLFTSVNGTLLTRNNYNDALDPFYEGKGFEITLAELQVNGSSVTVRQTNNKISLTSARIQEPSVYTTTILTTTSGRKVGYIFYNHFLDERSQELFAAFNEFKAAGVNELILDLRYNLGGGIAVSGLLSALAMEGYEKNKTFVRYNYNAILNAEIPLSERNTSFSDLYLAFSNSPDTAAVITEIDNKVKAANLNLPRIFVLGTDNSASASELVINNLASYIDVIHIGLTTVGKNEGSITIKDEREPRVIDWAIQPIIVKLANKDGQGDYEGGLTPDHEIDENNSLPFSPLGSAQDPLIAKALDVIDPTMARGQLSRTAKAPARAISFSAIGHFNERIIRPLPILIDRTIDKKRLERIRK